MRFLKSGKTLGDALPVLHLVHLRPIPSELASNASDGSGDYGSAVGSEAFENFGRSYLGGVTSPGIRGTGVVATLSQ